MGNHLEPFVVISSVIRMYHYIQTVFGKRGITSICRAQIPTTRSLTLVAYRWMPAFSSAIFVTSSSIELWELAPHLFQVFVILFAFTFTFRWRTSDCKSSTHRIRKQKNHSHCPLNAPRNPFPLKQRLPDYDAAHKAVCVAAGAVLSSTSSPKERESLLLARSIPERSLSGSRPGPIISPYCIDDLAMVFEDKF